MREVFVAKSLPYIGWLPNCDFVTRIVRTLTTGVYIYYNPNTLSKKRLIHARCGVNRTYSLLLNLFLNSLELPQNIC